MRILDDDDGGYRRNGARTRVAVVDGKKMMRMMVPRKRYGEVVSGRSMRMTMMIVMRRLWGAAAARGKGRMKVVGAD